MAETEIWQVETRDGIYQADLPTLKQWVAEGLVLPGDRVRKGALKWIEAGRAPMLRRVFNGEERVEIVAPTPQAAHVGAGVHQAETTPVTETSPDMGLAGDEAGGAAGADGSQGRSRRGAHALARLPCHFHPRRRQPLLPLLPLASAARAETGRDEQRPALRALRRLLRPARV